MHQALRKAIQNRRTSIVHDPHEVEERKDANLNPDEGSSDDLSIAMAEGSPREEAMESKAQEDAEMMDGEDLGLAPETHGMSRDKANSDQSEQGLAHKLFVKSDEGKPGIRGKVAAKMRAAMDLHKK